ncbi:MAG TPA: glycosyltransferase family 4 protein [Nanoarchaeota archaeon]|nr:glycosyltransferase family 4 protein [Nanoarchaeota archaeon]
MNVLITNSRPLGFGGAEISVMQFAQELKKTGHKVVIASSGAFPGQTTDVFRFAEKWPYFMQYFYLKRFFIRLIKKHSIDVINPQDRATTIAAIHAANECSIPVVINIRDYWFACPKSSCLMPGYHECVHCSPSGLLKCTKWYRYPIDLYKWLNLRKIWALLENAGPKIVASSALRTKLAGCGIIKDVHLLPVARLLKSFETPKGIAQFKKAHRLRKTVVTFIGSFFYTKGILDLFDFMPDILKSHPDVSLLLVGDGPLYNEIKKRIKENGIENQVVFAGRLPFKQTPVCYAVSDIVLIPHKWSEPFGAVMLEAAAAGKPSLTSDKGGAADFKNAFGYTLPAGDVSLWKEKTLFLITHSAERKALGKKAEGNVRKFDVAGFTANMIRFYKFAQEQLQSK